MSSLYKIFDFMPLEVLVVGPTATYDIPDDRYARVLVNLEGNASFTINGTIAIRGTQAEVASVGPTIPRGSGDSLLTSGSAGTGNHVWSSTTAQTAITGDIWLPAGTTISGSGTWRATVQLFAITEL